MTKHEARVLAFTLLFEADLNKDRHIVEIYANRVNFGEKSSDKVKMLALGVSEKQSEIDGIIEKYSSKWKVSRMSATTRNIIRLSLYEMMETDVPPKVSINEAVNIAKEYGDENAPAFVNGILNKIARENGYIKSEPKAEEVQASDNE